MVIERVVSPEVLERREFAFSEDDLNQIRVAKKFGKMVRGIFINNDQFTTIGRLDVMWSIPSAGAVHCLVCNGSGGFWDSLFDGEVDWGVCIPCEGTGIVFKREAA